MSKQTESNLFIISSLPQFYQQLLHKAVSYSELGNYIIHEIKIAHAFRRVERVAELSRLLLDTSNKEYQLIGQYYLFWCEYRNRQHDIDALEKIIDQTQKFKAKALLTRAAVEKDAGRNDAALYFCSEALKARPNISDYISTSLAIAVAKAAEGFNGTAIKEIEKILPMIRYTEPRLYYDFLNSYAVELGEAGRLNEARNICDVVLASPFAFAYPEWLATAEDLRGASRSLVAVNQSVASKAKLFHLPAVERSTSEKPAHEGWLASVISLPDWKKKMGKEPDGDHKDRPAREKSRGQATEKDLCFRLMGLIAKKNLTSDQLYEVIEFVENLPTMADSDAEQD